MNVYITIAGIIILRDNSCRRQTFLCFCMSFASVSPSICGTVVGNSGEEQGTTAPNNVPLTNTFGQRMDWHSSIDEHFDMLKKTWE